MHWHLGELIFNWESRCASCAFTTATAEQHSLTDKGFLTTSDWHYISWEIGSTACACFGSTISFASSGSRRCPD